MLKNEQYIYELMLRSAEMSYMLGFISSGLFELLSDSSMSECQKEKIRKMNNFLIEHANNLFYKKSTEDKEVV